MERTRPLVALLAATTLVMTACDGNGATEGEPGAPVETEGAPEELERFAAEWPHPNKDYRQTRFTTDSSIDSTNVADLKVAWTFDIPGAGPYGAAASSPLIADGTVYIQDLASNVFAIDLQSGDVRWERRFNTPVVGPNGPAIGYGKLFAHSGADEISALDLESGEVLWTTQLDGPTGAHQPVVFDGRIYTATQAGAVASDAGEQEVAVRGYAGGTTGYIYSLDEESGDVEWRFQVVEEGFWGNEEVNSGGGVWYPPAIDVETGMTFWGTGNPAPFPGIVGFPNAESRPGPNLYTNSILALDGGSGDLEWFKQVKPRDLFDLDFQTPRILTTMETDDGERDVVIGSGKLGYVMAFDAESGEILWSTRVGRHENDELARVPEGETIEVLPGVLGGVETPMALADRVVYVPVLDVPTPYTANARGAQDGTEAVINAEEATDFDRARSHVAALELHTGRVLWKSAEFDDAMFGGVTVVNDLLFVSTFDGTMYALDRENGAELWSEQAPAGIIAWPAVADDTLIWAAGTGRMPQVLALRPGG